MSTTAQYVFEQAMAIADEVPASGNFDSSDLDEYKGRTPYILTMLESEFIDKAIKPQSFGLSWEDAESFVGQYREFDLPENYYRIDEVSYVDERTGRRYPVRYRIESDLKLILPNITSGYYEVSYYAIPDPIRNLNDYLNVNDDVARRILPYGLAAELFKEENEYVFSFASARYQQLKNEYRKPAKFMDTVDCYAW